MQNPRIKKNGGICFQVSAVCLTSYTASVLTMIGSAFIVSHIPGTAISTSVSLSTSDLPSSLLQESSVSPTEQPECRVPPSVNVLATSFILASLGSCPSANDSDSSSGFLCNDSGTAHFHDQYLVNKSFILYTHGSVWWSELVSGWMRYMNWQLWESGVRQSLPLVHLPNTKARSKVHTIGQKIYKSDDTVNRSGAHTHEVTENGWTLEDSQEWIAEIHNWLDQTVLESSQTKFFPLEMTVSNY
jgi:hypothetical protein